MPFDYLGSPYSHADPAVRHARYLAARQALRERLEARIWTYSPIVHCHHLAVDGGMPTEAKFWEAYDFAMIRASDRLVVLTLPKWEESVGLEGEIKCAKVNSIPIEYLPPSQQVMEIYRNLVGHDG